MKPVDHRGLTVPARINARSGYFVVDTGAAHTLLNHRLLPALICVSCQRRASDPNWIQDVGKN